MDDVRHLGASRIGVGQALRRHWFIALLPIVLLVGAAYWLGVKRAETYTATARLAVADPDLNAPGALAGLSEAKQSMASAFARMVSATAVVRPVSRELGLRPEDVAARVSASPVPESPILLVRATGDSRVAAVVLANAAGRGLADFVGNVDDEVVRARNLFRRYQDVAILHSRRQSTVQTYSNAYGADPSKRNRIRLAVARGRMDAVRAQRDTLRALYQSAKESEAAAAQLQVIALASDATSDAREKRQALLFAGLAGGLALGVGLALLRANRAARRE